MKSKKSQRRVKKEYFSSRETGLEKVLRQSLRSLFSEQQLPDNPYYFLASTISAYIDQSPLWKESDEALLAAVDLEMSLEVVDAHQRICRVVGAPAFGLPHVLRLVNRTAVKALVQSIEASLPDCMLPECLPYEDESKYIVQIMCSIQGLAVLWKPSNMKVPEIEIRADILVTGPKTEEAVRSFLAVVLNDVADLLNNSLYFVQGLLIEDAPTVMYQGNKVPFKQNISLEDLASLNEDAEKMMMRQILSDKVITVCCCALIDPKFDNEDIVTNQQGSGFVAHPGSHFVLAKKQYFFHYCKPAVEPEVLDEDRMDLDGSMGPTYSHYGSSPYEALFTGYFTSLMCARQYLNMFTTEHEQPYNSRVVQATKESIRLQIAGMLSTGKTLAAYRQMLLLAMLADNGLQLEDGLQPEDLVPLEELVGDAKEDAILELCCVPNLLRILHSSASSIEALVLEMQAFTLAVKRWPFTHERLIYDAQKVATQLEWDLNKTHYTKASLKHGHKHAGINDLPVRLYYWLKEFNMDAQLLNRVVELKGRLHQVTNNGMFPGVSLVADQLIRQLPEAIPDTPEKCREVLLHSQHVVRHLMHLMDAAALTLAEGLLGRCHNVRQLMQGLDLIQGLVLLKGAADTQPEEVGDHMAPEWVLDVGRVTDSQIKSGRIAERVATEAVKLQYAVDTKLDVMLSDIYTMFTNPPMTPNPYPRLMHHLRSCAAKLEMFRQSPNEGLEAVLNALAMMREPTLLYAATPPAKEQRSFKGSQMRKQNVSAQDDDVQALYGSYAAIAMADCRALHSLRQSMPAVLASTHFQSGAYQVEVIAAVVNDVAFTNAMKLAEDMVAMSSTIYDLSDIATLSAPPPYLHPRFYVVEAEDHYLVSGPHLTDAARVFAEAVVKLLHRLHNQTMHLVHSLKIDGQTFDAAALATPTPDITIMQVLERAITEPQSEHPVAKLQLYVAVKEGLYVDVKKDIYFRHREEMPLAYNLQDKIIFSKPDGIEEKPSTPELKKRYWSRAMYTRIFFSEGEAEVWFSWHRSKGDPAQPFHYIAMVAEAERDSNELASKGHYLQAQKLLLLSAIAMNNHEAMFHLSCAVQSNAQELKCLQDMNQALVAIMSSSNCLEFSQKVDNERVRNMFLAYSARLQYIISSPKYCSVSGLALTIPKYLKDIREAVLSVFKLGSYEEDMDILNTWVACCEFSLAYSIHNCFDQSIISNLSDTLT